MVGLMLGLLYWKEYIFNIVNEKDDFGYNFFPKCLSKGFKLFGLKKNINVTPIDTPDLLSWLEKFGKTIK
jgi:hypothetical protein